MNPEKTQLKSLLLAIILIIAGTLSPSNGLDDALVKEPSEILSDALHLACATIGAVLLYAMVANGNLNSLKKQ